MNPAPNGSNTELPPQQENEVDHILNIIRKGVKEGQITSENFFTVTENFRNMLLTDFQRSTDETDLDEVQEDSDEEPIIVYPIEDPVEILTPEDLIRFETELKEIQNKLGVKNPDVNWTLPDES